MRPNEKQNIIRARAIAMVWRCAIFSVSLDDIVGDRGTAWFDVASFRRNQSIRTEKTEPSMLIKMKQNNNSNNEIKNDSENRNRLIMKLHNVLCLRTHPPKWYERQRQRQHIRSVRCCQYRWVYENHYRNDIYSSHSNLILYRHSVVMRMYSYIVIVVVVVVAHRCCAQNWEEAKMQLQSQLVSTHDIEPKWLLSIEQQLRVGHFVA